MSMKTFEDKFTHALEDIYDAEHQFFDVQREMLKNTESPELQKLLQDHQQQTTNHIANLEQAFKLLGRKAERHTCDAAKGLVTEAHKSLKDAGAPAIANWIIASTQSKIEHYEIASYRGLIIGAEVMGNAKVGDLLKQNLAQEEQTAEAVQDENSSRDLEEVMAERAKAA